MTFEAVQPGAQADEDARLIRRFRDGDAAAFDALYEKYYGRVYSLARGILNDADDALDAVQETFGHVWRNLGRFEAKSRFSTWLYRISVNTAIQFARRNKRHITATVGLEEAESIPGGVVPDVSDTREQVYQALIRLREEDRAVLVLYYWENQSLEEMAEILGCTANAAKTRLFRARERFREIWVQMERVHE
jgi:RNA polymerase sigma-70 factor (ECF subfamily)